MRTPRRDVRLLTPEKRAEILKAYERRTGTQKDFAGELGIGVSTLQSWLRKAAAEPLPEHGQFVRLPNLIPEQPAPVVYQIRFVNGLALEVHSGFRDEELGRLLPLLQRA